MKRTTFSKDTPDFSSRVKKPRKNNRKFSTKPNHFILDTKQHRRDDEKSLTVIFSWEGMQLTDKQKRNLIKTTSKVFLWLGVLCFVALFNMIILRLFPVQKPGQTVAATKQIPVEIVIKDVNIDLPIVPARFTNGNFETTTQGVSYLTSSTIPGETGNSVLYAHNWWNLFSNLVNVKKGEKIIIIFSDETEKTFTVASTQTVTANQVSILNKTTDNRLTIFTCNNFLDADRFVVVAMADQ